MWTYILYKISTYLPTIIKDMMYLEKAEILFNFSNFILSKFKRKLTAEEEEYELMSDWIVLKYRSRPELTVD